MGERPRRTGLGAPMAGRALLLILMLYVSGVHSLTLQAEQHARLLEQVRRVARRYPHSFSKEGFSRQKEQRFDRFHRLRRAGHERGGPEFAPPGHDAPHEHLSSDEHRFLAARALDAAVNEPGSHKAMMRQRQLSNALFDAHRADLGGAEAAKAHVPLEGTALLKLAGRVYHPGATHEQRVAAYLTLAHHTARHRAAAHLAGEVDADAAEEAAPRLHVPGLGAAFDHTVEEDAEPALLETGAGAGISLWFLAFVALLQGIATALFGKGMFFSFKQCTEPMKEYVANSHGNMKMQKGYKKFMNPASARPPVFTPKEVFDALQRPVNGVYRFYDPKVRTNSRGRLTKPRTVFMRYLGERDLSKYSPEQVDAMYADMGKMPACWEWNAVSDKFTGAWQPTSQTVVTAGALKGKGVSKLQLELLEYLQKMCPAPAELSDREVSQLLGAPLPKESFNDPDVYEYTSGWTQGKSALAKYGTLKTVYYRSKIAGRVGADGKREAVGEWEWAREKDAAKWTSVARPYDSLGALGGDQKHVAEYLATKMPMAHTLRDHLLLALGMPENVDGFRTYRIDYHYGVGRFQGIALGYEDMEVRKQPGFEHKDDVWQVSFDSGPFMNVGGGKYPSDSSWPQRQLLSYLEKYNPQPPSAILQAKYSGDIHSAFNPNSLLKAAERMADGFGMMFQGMFQFLGDVTGSVWKCAAEVRKECFGEPAEVAEADTEEVVAEGREQYYVYKDRLHDQCDVDDVIDGAIQRREMFDSLGFTREVMWSKHWGAPDSLSFYYKPEYQTKEYASPGTSGSYFLETNATLTAELRDEAARFVSTPVARLSDVIDEPEDVLVAAVAAQREREQQPPVQQQQQQQHKEEVQFADAESALSALELESAELHEALMKHRPELVRMHEEATAAAPGHAEAAFSVEAMDAELALLLDSMGASDDPLVLPSNMRAGAADEPAAPPSFAEMWAESEARLGTKSDELKPDSLAQFGDDAAVHEAASHFDIAEGKVKPEGIDMNTVVYDDEFGEEEGERDALMAELRALSQQHNKEAEEEDDEVYSNGDFGAAAGTEQAREKAAGSAATMELSEMTMDVMNEREGVLGELSDTNKCTEMRADMSQGKMLVAFGWGILGIMGTWSFFSSGGFQKIKQFVVGKPGWIGQVAGRTARFVISALAAICRRSAVLRRLYMLVSVSYRLNYFVALETMRQAARAAVQHFDTAAAAAKSGVASAKASTVAVANGVKNAASSQADRVLAASPRLAAFVVETKYVAQLVALLGQQMWTPTRKFLAKRLAMEMEVLRGIASKYGAARDWAKGVSDKVGAAKDRAAARVATQAKQFGKAIDTFMRGSKFMAKPWGGLFTFVRYVSNTFVGALVRKFTAAVVSMGIKLKALVTPLNTAIFAGFVAFNVYMNWDDIVECVKVMGTLKKRGKDRKAGTLKDVEADVLNDDGITKEEQWEYWENFGRMLVKIFF